MTLCMRISLAAVVVCGCWSSSSPPAKQPEATPAPAPAPTASVGGTTYGGATYGALGNGGSFASLTGTGDTASGFDDSNIYGGLLGNEPPPGGGGGIGNIGIGHSGTGSGYGVGHGRLSGANWSAHLVIGQPTVSAGLDKAIIRRYIKRNLQKVQYCYEKQLLAVPGLHGTVVATFTIGVDGLVTASTASGLKVVDACVADVIHGIEFPKPVGAAVTVTYPLTFKPDDK